MTGVAMDDTVDNKKKGRDKSGWQAKKSAMMRDSILDAAVDCFVNIGYANTTTARIACRPYGADPTNGPAPPSSTPPVADASPPTVQ